MRPVLDTIGFSKDAYCVQSPEGRSWTGSGILCTSRDLARFALLCMNGGEWSGKQLLNREYISEATSRQIDSSVTGYSREGRYGYGYQFWRVRDSGFGMYGMGSQYALCMPQHDTILITNGDTQGVDGAGDALFDLYFRLIEKMSSHPLPEDIPAQKRLEECINRLSIPRPLGKPTTTLAQKISGKRYVCDKNNAGIKWLQFVIETDKCRMQYENGTGAHELIFGMDKYEPQLFPEKYFGRRIGAKDTQYQCIGAGAWADEKTLLGTLYSVDDYLGSIKFQFTFAGDEICCYMAKSAEWFFDEYQGFLTGFTQGR